MKKKIGFSKRKLKSNLSYTCWDSKCHYTIYVSQLSIHHFHVRTNERKLIGLNIYAMIIDPCASWMLTVYKIKKHPI